MDQNFLFLSGAVAAIAAFWGKLKAIWEQLRSVAITSVILEYGVAEAILVYLNDNFSHFTIGPRTYVGFWSRVRSSNRIRLIAWEILNLMGVVYKRGRKVVWVQRVERKDSADNRNTLDATPSQIRLNYLRGAFGRDKLISDAVEYFNQQREGETHNRRRHFIKRVFGMSKKKMYQERDKDDSKAPDNDSCDPNLLRSARPIGVERSDIGTLSSYFRVDDMALSGPALEAVEEARRWKDSEAWYKSKSLPWRRGWLLHGAPGTGKTALVRSLSEEMDMPVFIYDLASLSNDELQSGWQDMLSYSPCVALIEDIDSVFSGRKNLVGDLTFDCLLNCLDGIERSDGLFTIITTNHPDQVDSAISVSDNGMPSRPGRIDRSIEMTPPDQAGRLKICQRILSEYPELWDSIIAQGELETGAQFQERCARLALKLFWDDCSIFAASLPVHKQAPLNTREAL